MLVQPAPAGLEVELSRKLDEPWITGSQDATEIAGVDIGCNPRGIKLRVVEQVVELETKLH